MGFFNKKELAEIERLKQQIERKDVINSELREELGEIGLGVDLLTDTIKNLEKTAGSLEKQRDDNYTSYLEVRENVMSLTDIIDDKEKSLLEQSKKLDSKDLKIKELETDIIKTINICADLEKELKACEEYGKNLVEILEKKSKEIEAKSNLYKEALTEIAEYDFDRHKKAYLLNDFFQERAKKALSEG